MRETKETASLEFGVSLRDELTFLINSILYVRIFILQMTEFVHIRARPNIRNNPS